MDYVIEKLKDLGNLARNPNLKGGVWNSFLLFVSISDELLQRKSLFANRSSNEGSGNDELIKTLESIRGDFESKFGFRLEKTARLGEKFESKKNNKKNSHKFRSQLSQYMKSFANRFHY